MGRLILLLPARRHFLADATLAARLRRADRLADATPGRDALLRECFAFSGTRFPAAALARSLDAADAAGTQWLRADPCHVQADTVAVRMLACGELGLTVDESRELAAALQPLFGDAGFPLEPCQPSRWYLRCPQQARLPQFADPAEVLGADLLQHLPRGENENQWRHLLNESQVILHNHPINRSRVRRGAVPANSLWFWGAGALPDWVRSEARALASPDIVARALARLAGVPCEDADAVVGAAATPGVRIVDCRDRVPAAAFAAREAEFRFASGERYLVRHWHRWRFWRRAAA